MYANLWLFLSATTVMSMLFVIVVVVLKHQRSMKEMEIEALRIKHANLPLDGNR